MATRVAASAKPMVAIVGRPNVGKSTLFNRLVGRQMAIVSHVSGTTRDRVAADTSWGEQPFILVDTGGLEPAPETTLWQKVKAQVEVAIAEADVIILAVDVTDGATATDQEVADLLRRSGKPLVLAVNKTDNWSREEGTLEFYELGLGDPIPISAYHNVGIDDLMSQVLSLLPIPTPSLEEAAAMRVAIVGRTNVGKSMLLNTILGQERAIVSDMPGTTRDAVDSLITRDEESILFIDTAGIRRRGRIDRGIEQYSVLRAVRALDRASVALLALDASELGAAQDTHIASYILEAHRGIVLVVNKWDLVPDLGVTKQEAIAYLREKFRFISYAPICFISALKGEGIEEMLDTATAVHKEWTKEVPQKELQLTMMNAVGRHFPPSVGKRHLRIYRVVQEASGPPTFTFYVNYPNLMHFSYQRYLENSIRKAFGFEGCHLKLVFKRRGE